MWDLSGPGRDPLFPALEGRFLTTGPPGKSEFQAAKNDDPFLGFIPKKLFSLTQMTYYLEIPDGLWILEKDQYYWEKNSRPETLPGTHGPVSPPSPGGLLCMIFCRGWWVSCRK